MAVVVMGGDDEKPIFHDFLGMSCDNSPAIVMAATEKTGMETEASASASASIGVSSSGHGIVFGSSEPVTERQVVNNSDVVLIHGRKNDYLGLEVSNTVYGRKRGKSDSAYTGSLKDKITPVRADIPECSRSLKILGKDVISERSGKYLDDEVQVPMQPLPRPTSSIILQSSLSSRPDLPASSWEQSKPMNSGSVMYYQSRIAQSGLFSSFKASKDANVSDVLISQPAADEGSRTGIKGSVVVNAITSSAVGERSISGVLPCSSRPTALQIIEPESSNTSRYHGVQNVGRQMTIFYAGQAHVFDDVHPNKAEVIMALAGSNGGSWSTSYFQKPVMCSSASEAKVSCGENQRQMSSLPFPHKGNPELVLSQVGRSTLTRDVQRLRPGGHQSGWAVRDGRLPIQAPLPSTEGKRDAS